MRRTKNSFLLTETFQLKLVTDRNFIFLSISSTTESNVDEWCAQCGRLKVDELVDGALLE